MGKHCWSNWRYSDNLKELYKTWSSIGYEGVALTFDESYIGKHRPETFWTEPVHGERAKYGWNDTLNGELLDLSPNAL